jgi:DNA-directed RNA polymerase specialized sigma24 family protein
MQAMGSDRLHALLKDLLADDRRLLESRIVDGWQYSDIAVHLGVARDVLADRVRRLRTALKERELSRPILYS